MSSTSVSSGWLLHVRVSQAWQHETDTHPGDYASSRIGPVIRQHKHKVTHTSLTHTRAVCFSLGIVKVPTDSVRKVYHAPWHKHKGAHDKKEKKTTRQRTSS